MNKKLLYFLLLSTVFFWGTSFAAVKLGMGALSPVQFIFMRTLFATIIFVLVLARTEKSKRSIDKSDVGYIFYLAFMGIGGYFVVQYTALKYTTTVNASLLIGIAPIAVAIYSHFFTEDKLGVMRIVGTLLCFVGIIFIITKGNLSSISFGDTMFGDLLMILNAIMLAAFSIGAKRMLVKYDPFIVVAYMNIFALIMMAPFVFTSNFISPVSLLDKIDLIDYKVILSSLYLGVTCTVLGYYSWYRGIKDIGASRTAVFNYINPLVASIMSFMLFDEGIGMFTLLGGLCIIGGVSLSNLQGAKGKSPAKTA